MKRYALVGCGVRGIGMYARAIARHYSDVAALAAICDTNRLRMNACRTAIGMHVPAFADFAAMLRETKPDAVIVASIDRTHDTYIIAALEAGCDVITEKPMTIDNARCRAVLAAEERSRRKVTVTFNYRYVPHHGQIRRLLRDGAIGRVASVDFHWYLDNIHGADYFRRWHRRLENCGGLLVHKASHHFDLINWWLDAEPEEVYASGRLAFYGPTRDRRGERCLTCDHKQTCEFYLDIGAQPHLRMLYLEAESEDGYHRDACVFADEIDIYDTMAATVQYGNGAVMSYSLNAFMPYEGYRLAFNGADGRLECEVLERAPGRSPFVEIRLARRGKPAEAISVELGEGEHGGGDHALLDALFRTGQPDPLQRQAGSRAGAMSLLTGVAANRSIATGQPVRIAQLLQPKRPASGEAPS